MGRVSANQHAVAAVFPMVRAPTSLLRTIAKALPEMDALQSLPRLVKVTMHAVAAALQMVRL